MKMHGSRCFNLYVSYSGKYTGVVGSYSGDGYAQLLGSSVNETLSILDKLKTNTWIDRGYACS